MSDELSYTDFASVRDALLDAEKRRGFLSYEQKMALQHAEWAASDGRGGIKTNPKTYQSLFNDLMEIDKLEGHPDICAKIAEIMPMSVDEARAILSSKRIPMDAGELEFIVDTVRKQVL
jgi:DNA-directed RNA polymerase subunit F